MISGSNHLNQTRHKKQITIIIIFIFILAFGIRLYRINDHPLVFHPIKQYHSALIARAIYLEFQKNIKSLEKNPPLAYRNAARFKEPKVIENLAVLGYKLSGGEHIWIPRLISVIFWIFSGLLIFLLVKMLFNSIGAIFSLLFYLFLPFGINISQSFIPEPLMTMFFIGSILMIVQYYNAPNNCNLIFAALVSGLAILIKFIVLFPIFGGFIFLGIQKKGLKKFLLNIHSYEFFLITFFSGILYYLYQVIFHSTLKGNLSSIVIPNLFFTSFFWKGWLQQIGKVTGLIPFFLSVFCFFTTRNQTIRALILGLFSGYFFYGIIFLYATATHDYYHMALFPIVIIMLGQIGKLIEKKFSTKFIKNICCPLPLFSLLIFVIIFFSLLYNFQFQNKSTEDKAKWLSYFLCGNQFAYFSNNRINAKIISNSLEIGEAVKHSTKTIILSNAYGKPLMYYGHFYGKAWPTGDDFWHRRLKGIPRLDASQYFDKYFKKFNPEYFIIHDKQLLERQPDLSEFLLRRFSKIKDTQDYIIFKIKIGKNS